MKDLVLLKIGGSVCTEKSKNQFKVREQAVARIGREIAEARKQKHFRLLIVNGAGPFGHTNVEKYGINQGLSTPRHFEGYVKTRCDCGHVNQKVSVILRNNGLLAVPYPSSCVIVQSNKRIVSFHTDVLLKMWHHNDNVIPVMNGDMVPDIKLVFSPMSGDRVMEYLAKRLDARLVVFTTDVEGIYTADPKVDKGASLIHTINKENFKEIRHGISGSRSVDVTGGMLRKIEHLVALGRKTVIINGNAPGRVRDVLLGKPVKGTVINP